MSSKSDQGRQLNPSPGGGDRWVLRELVQAPEGPPQDGEEGLFGEGSQSS